MKNIQSYYIKIDFKEYDGLYFIENNEKIEFILFFISNPIEFNINTNGYIFKFNKDYSLKGYSQDYLVFKNPSYENYKFLTIEIILRNDKTENLFEIKNLGTSESISYNSAFYYRIIEKNEENLIKINYLSEIEELYVFLYDEEIYLTNVQIIGTFAYLKLVVPYVKENYIFYKGIGFKDNDEDDDFYVSELFEVKISQNSETEVRFYFDSKRSQYYNNHPYILNVYGINENYYQDYLEKIKYEEFELYDDYIYYNNYHIFKKGSNFFKLPSHCMISKCKNKKLNIYIGSNIQFHLSKEINESSYFDFSNYSRDNFLEIEANEDFMLFNGRDERINKDIKDFEEKIHEYTNFYFLYENPHKDFILHKIFFIFAPKNEYYMENFQNECFIYKLCEGKIKDKDILIIEGFINDDFKAVLKKEYKEYLATIALKGRDIYGDYRDYMNYYFYNTIIIKVSQKVLDKVFTFWTPLKIILLVGGILIALIIFVLIMGCHLKKSQRDLNFKKEINEVEDGFKSF